MYNLTVRGAEGGRTPLKINVPIDSKTSGQIFMRFGIKMLSIWAGIMRYVSFDLARPKGGKPPNNVYTYGHKNCCTSRRKEVCNADKGDNSPQKRYIPIYVKTVGWIFMISVT